MDTKVLRQKILDLAIRGKLVPQDPNDEPASVLLERIRAEKQQVVKDGKLKAKDIKNDTVIFKGDDNLHYEQFADGTVKCIEDEIPFELPDGWTWARLGNIGEIITGGTPSKSHHEYYGNAFPFFKPADLDQGRKTIISSEYLSEKGKSCCRIIPKFSTAVCCIGSIGKCGYLNVEGTTNQQINSVIPNIDSLYAYYYCSSDYFLEQLLSLASATTIAIVNKSKMESVLIPVPPMVEQQRIANTLDTALGLIETLEVEKSDIIVAINNVKSKILDLAIRGKLVPQDPNDEPASVLLERIRAEKEELIKQGKIKRDKKESVIFKGDDNSYYLRTDKLIESLDDWRFDELPYNWSLCCLGEICDYGNCINVDSTSIAESAWILDLEDIEKDTGIVLKKIKKSERNAASTKHLFHKGQVLYSKLRPYLNKVVLADEDGYCTSEILPLDFSEIIVPEYARYFLMSPTFLRYANKCSYGVKMPRLGTTDGKKAILSLPPIEEQKRIVIAIEKAFSSLSSITENLS